MPEFDVAIIGAGPAGSATAIILARLGHKVLMLDRARFPRHKLCGDFLNPSNWPVLEALGVADAVRECRHARVSRVRIGALSGETAGGGLPLRDSLRSGLGIRRYFLDNVLVSRAKLLGVTVAEGCDVFGISREKTGWTINYRRAAGDEARSARLLVGADGRNSRVARQLKLGTGRPRNHGAIGFQIRLRMISGLEDSVEVHQVNDGYAGLVRLDNETVNLCFTVERLLAGQRVSFEGLFENFLKVSPTLRALLRGGEPCSELRSISPVYFPPRKRYGDGFLLVGDAAQVTEPVSGEGIYFALRGGQLAARTASAALRANETAAGGLESYENICNAEFAARVRLNRSLRVIMRHPALLAALMPLLRRPALFDGLVRRVCSANSAAPAAPS